MNEFPKDKHYWIYRGRCRNCQQTTDWMVSKTTQSWDSFRSGLWQNAILTLHPCQKCNAHAVFDLVGMSQNPKG